MTSIPDHILVGDDLLQYDPQAEVGDDVGSDHLPISLKIPLPTNANEREREPLRSFRNFNKTDWDIFKKTAIDASTTTPATPLNSPEELEQEATNLTAIFSDAIERSTPLQHQRGYRPTLPAEVVALIKHNRKTRRQARNNPALKKIYNSQTKRIRKLTREHFSQAYTAATKNLSHKDGSLFWKAFKQLSSNNKEELRPFIHEDTHYATDQDKANILAELQAGICSLGNNQNFNANNLDLVTAYIRDNSERLGPSPRPQPPPPGGHFLKSIDLLTLGT